MLQQLPLPIHLHTDDSLNNFYADNNLLLLNSLRKNFTRLQQQFFYLWGIEGCGKSHLLRAAVNYFLSQQRSAIYLPLNKAENFSPAVLDKLEQQDLVCLDDLHAIITHAEWELAVFDLINRIKETGKTLLLISANQSPTALQTQLPDLASRLSWGEIYQLNPLDEKQKILVLQQNAHQRGIELPDDTANFLLKRLNRDMHTLFDAL
ncbi:MAG TPA: DnaA regulatory inactivator Hda, partial [Pasteurellaceae bacterium]|nr:DnaA regulatory inactivator Hda [Pasteurellaceae bacterium]